MIPVEWASASPPWLSGDASVVTDISSRVLFTRSVRRRNFTGFPFWVSCPPETCAMVNARARDFAGTTGFSKTIVLPDYSPEDIGFFRERQWLPERPVTFPGKRDFKMLFLSSDPDEHALVGEVEHWTQIHVRQGLPETIDAPSTPGLMESAGPFTHSPGYGFLTSNPAFAGTGLQMECAVHLPALTALRRTQSVQQALNALGLELQPLSLRIPGMAEAGFFRVLSRGGMILPEEALYQWFAKHIRTMLATENEALEKWHEQEKSRLEDRIHRSLRMLQEARNLDYSEFLTLMSFTRVGVYSGHFPASLLPELETLRMQTLPFHAAILQDGNSTQEIDAFRANRVRSLLASK